MLTGEEIMIVVTAPTGQIGRGVVERLLAADAPVRVIARDPGRLAPEVRDRVEVVQGSHGDADVVDKAFAGADAVFWLVPADPRASSVEDAYVGFSRPAVEAFAKQEVGRVVGISALGRGTPVAGHAGNVTATLAVDDLIADTGVPYRALTMPSFMDNLLRQAQLIRDQGMFTSPIRGAVTAPSCATRDITAVAASLLLDDTWSGVDEVPVLGPEDLSWFDMATTMSRVLERPIRFQQVSGDDYTNRLTQFGMSDAMAQAMLDMVLAKDAGLDNGVTRTPETSTPTTFEQWCADVLKPAVQG
jgi:uncharacterized protein YbjT (DUF2867 family)